MPSFDTIQEGLENVCGSGKLFKEKLKQFLGDFFILACEKRYYVPIIDYMFERYPEEMTDVDLDKGYEIACKNRHRDLVVYILDNHLEYGAN